MLKKILLGVGGLILIFVLYSVYVLFIAAPVSPLDTVSYSDQGLDISVSYSQPAKKGRLIFGEEADEALQPYGQYWRLGANAATEVTFSKDVNFAGEPVDAGTYRMYAFPGAETFEIGLNTELGVFFGIGEPDYELDVLRLKIPTQTVDEVESLKFKFSSESVPMTPDEPFSGVQETIYMDFAWDQTMVRIPITVQ